MIEVPTTVRAKRPSGVPFVLDSCAFNPGAPFDCSALSIPEGKLLDWPMVYILSNDECAYVGQTTSVATRMNQHGANEEKGGFRTSTVIFHEEFNASVITDYEHRLIGLMHADGRYRLTNKNDGMTDTSYFSKSEYGRMFEDLWEELRGRSLAVHSIDEIEESEVFKYSPYKGLNPEQHRALEQIMEAIEGGLETPAPLVVEGGPGTGKTILAIYLLKMLKDDPLYQALNVRIVEPVTSLKKTLQNALKTVEGLDPSCIIGPADLVKSEYGYVSGRRKCFDILLVDETHRLKRRVNLGTQFGNFDNVSRTLGFSPTEVTQLDWIMDQAKLPVLFYDPLQSVGPFCLGAAVMSRALGEALAHPIRLESQMRVRGGDDYLGYVRAILDGEDPAPRTFPGYDLVLHESFSEFTGSFERTHREHDLSRYLAGYAWEWKTRPRKGRAPATYDIEIESTGLRWNRTYDNWVPKGADDEDIAHEVGCIHSIQGYDLSYAYVIIGDDLRLNPRTGELEADRASYFDRNGYATATPQELTAYIKNIYYVLLTRGIYGTHVYVHDPELRAYLGRYFVDRVA